MKAMNSISRKLIVFAILIVLFQAYSVLAVLNKFADLNIKIEDNGFVTISDVSNNQSIIVQDSQIYTTKKKDIWTFNYSDNFSYSDYLVEIHLPANAGLTYLKTSGIFTVNNDENGIVVKTVGKNSVPFALMQYKLGSPANNSLVQNQKKLPYNSDLNYLILFVIIIVILFAFSLYNRWQNRKTHNNSKRIEREDITAKKHNSKYQNNMNADKENINESSETENSANVDKNAIDNIKRIYPNMPYRQKQILALIKERNGIIVQSELEKLVDFPKSSLSRNLASLELHGIISKEKVGMANKITLKSFDKGI